MEDGGEFGDAVDGAGRPGGHGDGEDAALAGGLQGFLVALGEAAVRVEQGAVEVGGDEFR